MADAPAVCPQCGAQVVVIPTNLRGGRMWICWRNPANPDGPQAPENQCDAYGRMEVR
jgi:hypothetical protein